MEKYILRYNVSNFNWANRFWKEEISKTMVYKKFNLLRKHLFKKTFIIQFLFLIIWKKNILSCHEWDVFSSSLLLLGSYYKTSTYKWYRPGFWEQYSNKNQLYDPYFFRTVRTIGRVMQYSNSTIYQNLEQYV